MTDTTQRLKTALCRTLSDASIVIGQTEFKKGGVFSTRYDNRNTVTSERLREIHQRNRLKDTRPEHAQTASVNVSSTVAAELADILRDMLEQHIDERADRIGNAFPLGGDGGHFSKMTPERAAGCARVTSLDTFVAGLVRGAAVLGPDRRLGGGSEPLPAVVDALLPPADDGDSDGRAGERLWVVRRSSGGALVRSDAGGGAAGRLRGRKRAGLERRLLAVRRALGVRAGMPAVGGSDQG